MSPKEERATRQKDHPVSLAHYQKKMQILHQDLQDMDNVLTQLERMDYLTPKVAPRTIDYFRRRMKKVLSLFLALLLLPCTSLAQTEEPSRSTQVLERALDRLHKGGIKKVVWLMDSAILIAQQEKDFKALAFAHDAKGGYLKLTFDPAAQYHYEQGLHYFKKINDRSNICALSRTLGIIHHEKGNADSAFYYFELSGQYDDSVTERGVNNKNAHYGPLGDLLSDLGRTDEAIEAYIQSMDGPR
ncbi:MAG: hypothetical protein AAFO69_19605, partial [Bacteroidota bacterium]